MLSRMRSLELSSALKRRKVHCGSSGSHAPLAPGIDVKTSSPLPSSITNVSASAGVSEARSVSRLEMDAATLPTPTKAPDGVSRGAEPVKSTEPSVGRLVVVQ